MGITVQDLRGLRPCWIIFSERCHNTTLVRLAGETLRLAGETLRVLSSFLSSKRCMGVERRWSHSRRQEPLSRNTVDEDDDDDIQPVWPTRAWASSRFIYVASSAM